MHHADDVSQRSLYHSHYRSPPFCLWENPMKDERWEFSAKTFLRMQKPESQINMNCLNWKPLIKPWLFTKLIWFWLRFVLLFSLLCIQFQSWRTENLTLRPAWLDLINLIWLRSPSYDRNHRKQRAARHYDDVWCINQELRGLATVTSPPLTKFITPSVNHWNRNSRRNIRNIYHSLKPNAMH